MLHTLTSKLPLAFVIENCMVEILTTSPAHITPILNTNRGFHIHTKLAILAKVSQLTAQSYMHRNFIQQPLVFNSAI